MKYEIRFMINEHGYKKIIEADNEAMARQKLLASINIVKCETIKDEVDSLKNIFGMFDKK